MLAAALLALLAACSVPPPAAPPGPSLPLSSSTPTTEGAPVTAAEQAPEEQYLAQLRAKGVPMSVSGSAEIQIGRGICNQRASGSSEQALAKDIVSIGWTAEQAADIVAAAQRFLCS